MISKFGPLIYFLNFVSMMNIIFHQVLCSAVAVVQHYLHTAIFTWMLVEGINLYSKLVKIFDVKRPYALYSAIGWGKGKFITDAACSSRSWVSSRTMTERVI